MNPVDDTLRAGGIKGRVQFPKIPGNEAAGIIVEGNPEYPEGTRVIISCITSERLVRGGAVGNATIQLAKALGASQVIITAGSAEKAAVMARAGIENIIDLSRHNIPEEVARITNGKGVDIVIDMVGGAITGAARAFPSGLARPNIKKPSTSSCPCSPQAK